MTAKSDIYVHLISNASLDKFPNNSLSRFTVAFDQPLELSENYKVGLVDISISNRFLNVGNDKRDRKIELSYLNTREEKRLFRSNTTDLESAFKRALLEFDVSFTYEKSRYVFHLPENVKSVHFDESVRRLVGAERVTTTASSGSTVKRIPKEIPKLNERQATAILIQDAAAIESEHLVINKHTTSLCNVLKQFFKTKEIEGTIEYADNVYTLSFPRDFKIPDALLKLINVSSTKEEGNTKHLTSSPVLRTYSFSVVLSERVSFDFFVPAAYYETVQSLIERINAPIGEKALFTFDEHEQKCHLHMIEDGVTLKLSDYLAIMLGYESKTDFAEDTSGTDVASTEPPFYSIIVYSDLAAPTFLGSSKKQILKVLPFHYEKDKHVLSYTFDTVQYFNLSHYDVSSVTILLANEAGRQLPLLPKGRTSLTLHFKYGS